MRRGCGLHLQLLEVVFAAVIARVSACDSFCALLRNLRQLNFRSVSEAQLAVVDFHRTCEMALQHA